MSDDSASRLATHLTDPHWLDEIRHQAANVDTNAPLLTKEQFLAEFADSEDTSA